LQGINYQTIHIIMKVTLKRLDEHFGMLVTNQQGDSFAMDGMTPVGVQPKGMRPMEVVLAGLGGCSTIDVIDILKKQRQIPDQVLVSIDAERAEDQIPKVFTKIHLHFAITGKVKPEKATQAVQLSLEKYCSVAKMLEKTARITADFSLNGQKY
jgi:putative redox protein